MFATEILTHRVYRAVCEAVLLPSCSSYQLNIAHVLDRGPGSEQQLIHRDEIVGSTCPAEPVAEGGLAQLGTVTRNERALGQDGAEVAGAGVGDNLARIVAGPEAAADEVVEAERLRSADLDHAVQRGTDGDAGHRRGDVLGSHGLNEHRRQTDDLAVGGVVGDAADELEELRGVDDRIRDGGPFDQLLLSGLRPHVAALGQPIGADHRQGDVMTNAGGRLRVEEVAGRGLEELEHGSVLERRRVRHVDDHLCALERIGDAFTGERVHARVRRRRDRFVAGVAELGDELRADEPGTANHDEFHDDPFVGGVARRAAVTDRCRSRGSRRMALRGAAAAATVTRPADRRRIAGEARLAGLLMPRRRRGTRPR